MQHWMDLSLIDLSRCPEDGHYHLFVIRKAQVADLIGCPVCHRKRLLREVFIDWFVLSLYARQLSSLAV